MDARTVGSFVLSKAGSILLLTSLILPISLLYTLHPDSFQLVWEARTPYVIFLWFFGLELALGRNDLRHDLTLELQPRLLLRLVVTLMPTMYVVATSRFGFDESIRAFGTLLGVPYLTFGRWFLDVSWPIAFEYLTLAASFTLSILVTYGACNLRRFLVAVFFLWSTTAFFLLNTFAPYGTVGALQAFVPFTTNAAAQILEAGGFQTAVQAIENGLGPGMALSVTSETASYSAVVYWPSAGIQSLIIYTGVMSLFIKDLPYSMVRKVGYLLLGAVGTFLVNLCRIASIMTIGVRIGRIEASMFHDYYGEFFFIAWMAFYLVLLAFGSNVINRVTGYLRPCGLASSS